MSAGFRFDLDSGFDFDSDLISILDFNLISIWISAWILFDLARFPVGFGWILSGFGMISV